MNMGDIPAAAIPGTSLSAWVEEVARLTRPEAVVWCDGSEEEAARLTQQALHEGILLQLNDKLRPGCYLHRSNPNDVARTEDATFICTPTRDQAGPTNNWSAPAETYRKLGGWLKDSMRGRTMYVVPYVMGPLGSPFSRVGVELTDSIYVVLNMRIMTRMGKVAMDAANQAGFHRGLHCTLDLNPERRLICHFPQDDAVWSVGSGYGGNALLSKKCLSLRIASWLAREEGWLAEHMLIVGLQNPAGETTYVAAAFPSACGKTNLAMLMPPASMPGWKIFTVGDDIAWLRIGADGRLWAVNPEFGYFGVAPGTNGQTNPNAMRSVGHDTIFTNVALTAQGDVWWEGCGVAASPGMIDWQGRPWTPQAGHPAAHPNSRFTTPMTNNPVLSPHANDPQGVPISAIIFGGRRATTIPLVTEAFDWSHGVYLGATMGSETTAAATGKVGVVRRDPMAMLPFCGYNICDYFQHWLSIGKRLAQPPKIFMVNWFRRDREGSFLWPGYGENLRVLDWMIRRVNGRVGAQESAVGMLPRAGDINLQGLDLTSQRLAAAMALDASEWSVEAKSQGEFFANLGPTLPAEVKARQQALARVYHA
jgi:phosphoenolpyruvate carboxykinase (GTP)